MRFCCISFVSDKLHHYNFMQGAVQEEKEELKTEMFTDLDEEEEEEESTHNIFNPEVSLLVSSEHVNH